MIGRPMGRPASKQTKVGQSTVKLVKVGQITVNGNQSTEPKYKTKVCTNTVTKLKYSYVG